MLHTINVYYKNLILPPSSTVDGLPLDFRP